MSASTVGKEDPTDQRDLRERYPSLPYVAPFVLFLLLLAGRDYLAPLGRWEVPATVVIMAAAIWYFSRDVLSFRAPNWVASTAVGVAVFFLWIGPDVLWPGYREHWLFQNSLTGKLNSSIPKELLGDPLVMFFRTFRAVIIVAIIEELFWRAWLLRWLVAADFRKLPPGAWSPASFAITAVLFASEHGPFWDVGLLTGVIYNWWMIRTRSLGDCILMHAVTNLCLSAYVMYSGRWQYWM